MAKLHHLLRITINQIAARRSFGFGGLLIAREQTHL
jgi:hypothetical protein